VLLDLLLDEPDDFDLETLARLEDVVDLLTFEDLLLFGLEDRFTDPPLRDELLRDLRTFEELPRFVPEDLFTDPDFELDLDERLTLEELFLFEPELLDTVPDERFLVEVDLTRVVREDLDLLLLDTLLVRLVLNLVEEFPIRDTLLLFLLERDDELILRSPEFLLDLVTYFCVKPLLLAP